MIFPIHPRTEKKMSSFLKSMKNLHIVNPLSYLEFNYLVEKSKAIITDSGGITEEASVMNVPCLTLRDNTERPETITFGTNRLVGYDPKKIEESFKSLFQGKWKKYTKIPLWDGQTSDRIIQHILNEIKNENLQKLCYGSIRSKYNF